MRRCKYKSIYHERERQGEPTNAETLEAFNEGDEMLKAGTGQRINNADELFEALEA